MDPGGPDEEAAEGDVNNIPCPAGRDPDHYLITIRENGEPGKGCTVRDDGAERDVAVPG